MNATTYPPRAEFEAAAMLDREGPPVRVVVRQYSGRWCVFHRMDLADTASVIANQGARWREATGGGLASTTKLPIRAVKRNGKVQPVIVAQPGEIPVTFYDGINRDGTAKGSPVAVSELFDTGTARKSTKARTVRPGGRADTGERATASSKSTKPKPKATRSTKARSSSKRASSTKPKATRSTKARSSTKPKPKATRSTKARSSTKPKPKPKRGPVKVSAYARRRGRPTDRDRFGRWTWRRGR